MDKTDSLKLKNRVEGLAWLKNEGFKISKGKLYGDAKSGLLLVEADGSLKISELERYARRVGLKRSGRSPRDQLAVVQLAKQHKELELLTKRNERLSFENDRLKGRYIPREDWEQELSARAAVLLHGLRHMAQIRSSELLDIGKAQGPQAMGDRLQSEIEDLLNDYANRETFKVIVMPDGDMQIYENDE